MPLVECENQGGALMWRVDELIVDDPSMERRCTFLPPSRVDQGDNGMVNLSSLLEEAALQLRKDVPLELVVNMFQKLVRAMSSPLSLRVFAYGCVPSR